MADRVLFNMHSGFRAQLIEKHEFYVSHAKTRLLEQFTDEAISQEADRASDESWKKRGRNFDPDRHDLSDFAEAAYDDGIWRYQLLNEMRDNVRLSIIAGFFHGWEKNLRQWLVDEIRHWHQGEGTRERIWKANLLDLFALLESFSWNVRSSEYFADLDSCRLVVNVFKHGDGTSLSELAEYYPRFLRHPLASMRGEISQMWFKPRHEHLTVSDQDLEAFSRAVIRFWSEVPENVLNSQINTPPSWLVKAIEKDNQQKEKSK